MDSQDMKICPYCGDEMHLGYFGGVRYQLEWIPEGQKQRKHCWASIPEFR